MRKGLSRLRRNTSRSIKRSVRSNTPIENLQKAWIKVLTKLHFGELAQKKNTEETHAALIKTLSTFYKKHPHTAIAALLTALKEKKDAEYIFNLIANQQKQLQEYANYKKLETLSGPIFHDLDNPKNNELLKVSLFLIASAKLLSTCHHVPAKKPADAFNLPFFIEQDLSTTEEKMLSEADSPTESVLQFLELHKNSSMPQKAEILQPVIDSLKENDATATTIAIIREQRERAFLDEVYTPDKQYCLTSTSIYKTGLYLECADRILTKQLQATRVAPPPRKRSLSPPPQTQAPRQHISIFAAAEPPLTKKFDEVIQKFNLFLSTRFDDTNSTGIDILQKLLKKQTLHIRGSNTLDEVDRHFLIQFFNTIKDRVNSRWGSRYSHHHFWCPGRHENVLKLYNTLLFSKKRDAKEMSTEVLCRLLISKLSTPFITEAVTDLSIQFTHAKC